MQKYLWTLMLLTAGLAFGSSQCQQKNNLDANWRPQEAPSWLHELSSEELVAMSKNKKTQQLGAQIFAQNCAACHGSKGEGKVSSSLNDGVWQFSNGSPEAVVKTIWWGIPEKGMPSWAKLLKPDEFKALGAHLYTLAQKPAEASEESGEVPSEAP